MNRILLIGNGFDLAHGYKTKYEDFIFYFIKKSIINKIKNTNEKNYLIDIQTFLFGVPLEEIEKCSSLEEILNYTYIINRNKIDYGYFSDFEQYRLHNYYNVHTNKPIQLFFKHIFLERTIHNIYDLTWAGFEKQYYLTMLDIINHTKVNYDGNIKHEMESIKELNNYFAQIKYEFIEYLKQLNDNFDYHSLASLNRLKFFTHSTFDLLTNGDLRKKKMNPDLPKEIGDILVVDFNYTKTAYNYKVYSRNENIQYIPIHGTFVEDESPIIFGYGDETEENYITIENRDNNEYLRFFKSSGYLQNSYYSELMSFIKNGIPFEVFILGHSCGLSDRVMLKSIFENHSCKQIRLFYHQYENGDNYTELIQNITRHFSLGNKEIMRTKVISKDKSIPF